MRAWTVAGAVVEGPDGLLLVRNERRGGRVDWSPPGGVIDEGETVIVGLTREVVEETGLRVEDWQGPLYEIEAEAPGLGWTLRVEAHLATNWTGELTIDDPDGIVVEAGFFDRPEIEAHLEGSPRWVHEPLLEWLDQRWVGSRSFHYRVDGDRSGSLEVVRL